MKVSDRVQEILNGYPFDEVASAFKVDKAAKLEACSKTEIYRRVAKGTMGYIKADGAERGRRGRAGGLTFTLEHIVRYRVEHEVLPGQAPRAIEEDEESTGTAAS